MEQNLISKENIFEHKSMLKNYIIGITKDIKDKYIIITIASKKEEIINQRIFTFKEIEAYDREFFVPFKNNFLILYKFLIRLLKSNLIDVEIIRNENKDIACIVLNCLKNNEYRFITIDVSNQIKDYNKPEKSNEKTIDYFGEAPAPVNKKSNKYKIKFSNKNDNLNKKYDVDLRKIQRSEKYKEIEVKITNKRKRDEIYFDYLNLKDIFDRNIPYYNKLFDCSIDDVFDDLNIIVYHHNYRFEEASDSIKLFFHVFNIGQGSKGPYDSIYIQALNRERKEVELTSKENEFFKWNLTKTKLPIDNFESVITNENTYTNKEINKDNYCQNFLHNFLNSNNKNSDKKEDIENHNITQIKDEKKKEDENSKENNFQKNFKNNNSDEQDNKSTPKIGLDFTNQKRYRDTTIEMFIKKDENKGIKQKNAKSKSKLIEKKSIWENFLINNKTDSGKKINDKKILNLKKGKKEKFQLDENQCYNINKEKVKKQYLHLLYRHPLDNDDELEEIKNDQKTFYLCKICKWFSEKKDLTRNHQWEKHSKPFHSAIQQELLSKNNKI